MVRRVRNKKISKRNIRHTAPKNKAAMKRQMSTGAIVRCPKCKEGRILKARGLTFCGFCGKEF